VCPQNLNAFSDGSPIGHLHICREMLTTVIDSPFSVFTGSCTITGSGGAVRCMGGRGMDVRMRGRSARVGVARPERPNL